SLLIPSLRRPNSSSHPLRGGCLTHRTGAHSPENRTILLPLAQTAAETAADAIRVGGNRTSARPGWASPRRVGHGTQSPTVFVDDVDAYFDRAKSAGAKIAEELNETAYGEQQYGTEDLEGHHWLFSKHVRDVSPDEWGATIPPLRNLAGYGHTRCLAVHADDSSVNDAGSGDRFS